MTKNPINGCRPAQLLGPWLMEQGAYDALMDQAAFIIESGRLETVSKESRELVEAEEAQPPYTIENGVARFSINGPMTRYPTSFQSAFGGAATLPVQRAVREARSNGFVSAAFFEISSPGGTTEGIEDFCQELARFRAVKPLRMHIAAQGTSAAQRVGIEGDVLTIDPMGIAGSVGVLTRLRDTSELMRRAGVKDHYIASGDRKTDGAPGTVITDEQIAARRALVDGMNRSFLAAVELRRPRTKDHIKDIARAGLYDAHKTVEIGLADAVMTTDAAFEQFSQRLPFGSGRTLPG